MTLLEQQLQSLLEQHQLSVVLDKIAFLVSASISPRPDSVEQSYWDVGTNLHALAAQMRRIEADRP